MSGSHAKEKQRPEEGHKGERLPKGAQSVAVIGAAGAVIAAVVGALPAVIGQVHGSAAPRPSIAPPTARTPASNGSKGSPVRGTRPGTPSVTPTTKRTSPALPTFGPSAGSASWPSLTLYNKTWVDLDPASPTKQAVTGDKPPAAIDFEVGPVGAYSDDAQIWISNGTGSCDAQASDEPGIGYQRIADIAAHLPTPAAHVTLCVVTTMKRVGTLDVTSVDGNGDAPYVFRYHF